MTCLERQKMLDLQEQCERTEDVLKSRIERERKDRKAKQLDTLLIGIAVMMCGFGGAAFIYALASFAHWAEFGY